MVTKTLSFTLERETKTTARYREELKFEGMDSQGLPPAIGTLHLQKWMVGKEPPKTLTIVISMGEEEAGE